MRTVRKIVTVDEQGAVHLDVPVGLRGKVLEMLLVSQEARMSAGQKGGSKEQRACWRTRRSFDTMWSRSKRGLEPAKHVNSMVVEAAAK